MCGANLLNPGEEHVERTDTCDYAKKLLSIHSGTLVLTNRRLLWLKGNASDVGFAVGGLVGGLVAGALSKDSGKAGFSLPLEEITGVEDARQGVRGGVRIHTRDGESYKLLIPFKNKDWKELLLQTCC